MAKYLYGAAVQGIQGFIFQTSKLQEIVGASELVEQICDGLFRGQVNNFKEENLILSAAGNIKYIFDNEDDCQDLVRKFPKIVMERAPGITISQAVVRMDIDNPINELENRLRVQRNKVISNTNGVGLMVTEVARKTGGVGISFVQNEVLDASQVTKREQADAANRKLLTKISDPSKGNLDKFPFDISDMVKREANKSWIAVIHADGNNLGNKIMEFGETLIGEEGMQAFKEFSRLLNESTVHAAREAFNSVIGKEILDKDLKAVPFRPVILGGDDFTGIIGGDLALDFSEAFLEAFESLTKENFKSFAQDHGLKSNPFSNGLTACVGIAYIKANYPFHYGVSLAENLCQHAKKHSRMLSATHSPSSIMFHRVQSSFVEEFDDIIDTELTAKNDVRFDYGPYFISPQENYLTMRQLKELVRSIGRKDAPKSGLRNWLNELKSNSESASQSIQRIADLNKKDSFKKLFRLSGDPFTVRGGKKFTPIYDAISLSNIN